MRKDLSLRSVLLMGVATFYLCGTFFVPSALLAASDDDVLLTAKAAYDSVQPKNKKANPADEGDDIFTTNAAAVGINLPAPPPPISTFVTDNQQLQEQATIAAQQASTQLEEENAKQQVEQNRQSYDRASKGLLPLSPDQIRDFMHRLETVQEASLPPAAGPPKGEVKFTTLSLDPGVTPPQINLAAGYVTTVTLLDATGEPWPIVDVGVGGNFELTPTTGINHVVRITPLTRFGTGNLSILLRGLTTPIIFRLSAGGGSVDMRYDARVPKYGPGAKLPLIGGQKLEAGDQVIMLMLQNAPPKDAKRMKVSGLDSRTMAWMLNDKVYVRTPLALLSPAWDASVSSSDGMTVYQINDAPVLLMSDNGAMVRARLLRE